MQEIQVWSLGWEDPLEEEMATHPSILSWEIPWTEEPGGLRFMESQRVRYDLTTKHQQVVSNTRIKLEWTLWKPSLWWLSWWRIACNAGDWVQSLGWKDPLDEGTPLQYSGLEQSMGSQRVGHDWVTFTFFHSKRQAVMPQKSKSLTWGLVLLPELLL